MIVVDTSAWVEQLRDTPHPAGRALDALLRRREEVAITDVIYMELLAGAGNAAAVARLRAGLLALPILRTESVGDHEQAAAVYRACRDAGHTIRSQVDCLIAVVAMRQRATLLHNDRDFEVIARHTTLKVHPVRA